MIVSAIPRSTLVFSGTTSEYFKIWIFNVCLTLVTLGIYSPWAKVRRLRYFHGNTALGEHGFAYAADPVRILKGRIIAVTALLLYVATTYFAPHVALGILSFGILLTPAIIVVAARFNLRNTTYRNVRFDLRARIMDAYRMFIIPLFVLVAGAWSLYFLTENSHFVEQIQAAGGDEFHREELFTTYLFVLLGPLLPYLDYLRVRFLANHIFWGNLPFRFEGGASRFYEIYIVAGVIAFALLLVTVFGGGALFVLLSGVMRAVNAAEPPATGPDPQDMLLLALMGGMVGYGCLIFSAGYLRARRSNLILSATHIEGRLLRSDLGAWKMGWLYAGNTIAILFSAGLLIPWAMIRTARYVAARTGADVDSSLLTLNTGDGPTTAMGEEMVDAFDMDIGL